MHRDKKTKGEFSKSARIISEYVNDLIFEQPRENLLKQEFVSYEYTPHGIKRTIINRKFTKDGNYNDTSSVEILS